MHFPSHHADKLHPRRFFGHTGYKSTDICTPFHFSFLVTTNRMVLRSTVSILHTVFTNKEKETGLPQKDLFRLLLCLQVSRIFALQNSHTFTHCVNCTSTPHTCTTNHNKPTTNSSITTNLLTYVLALAYFHIKN